MAYTSSTPIRSKAVAPQDQRCIYYAFENRHIEYKMPFYFPTIGQYAGLLERSGFKVLHMSLFVRMTPLKGPNELADWIKMFIKKPLKIYQKKKKHHYQTNSTLNWQGDTRLQRSDFGIFCVIVNGCTFSTPHSASLKMPESNLLEVKESDSGRLGALQGA